MNAKPALANGADITLATETWTVRLLDGSSVPVEVRHHRTRDDGLSWCGAHATWPGIPYALHLSGNTADRAVNRLVAAAINTGTDEDAVGVRELIPPGEATRDEAVAAAVLAEREACKAAVRDAAAVDDNGAPWCNCLDALNARGG